MTSTQKYYIFFSLLYLGFASHVTAYAPFLESIGLSLAEIALINMVFWVTIILSELPTGMLADGRSRAYSLKLGALFYALGALSYTFAQGFWTAAFAEAVIGIGGAFISGAGAAWIADALDREGRKDELRHVYATEALIKAGLFLGGGFVGSWMLIHQVRLIWVPFVVASFVASLFAHKFMNGLGEPLEYVSEREAFKRAVNHLRGSYALMWVIGALIVFGAVVSFNHYWSLFFLPQVGEIGLGYVWAVMYAGVAVASQIARRLKTPLGSEANLIVGSLLLAGVGLGFAAYAPNLWFSIPAVLIHEIGRGFFHPLTGAFVQHRIHTSYRATFGSLQSFLGRIGFAIVPLIVWLLIANEPNTIDTITQVWFACAIVLVTGGIGLWFVRPREQNNL